MGQSMPWIGTRQRDWPIFGRFWAERTEHLHYDEKDTVVGVHTSVFVSVNISRFLKSERSGENFNLSYAIFRKN